MSNPKPGDVYSGQGHKKLVLAVIRDNVVHCDYDDLIADREIRELAADRRSVFCELYKYELSDINETPDGVDLDLEWSVEVSPDSDHRITDASAEALATHVYNRGEVSLNRKDFDWLCGQRVRELTLAETSTLEAAFRAERKRRVARHNAQSLAHLRDVVATAESELVSSRDRAQKRLNDAKLRLATAESNIANEEE